MEERPTRGRHSGRLLGGTRGVGRLDSRSSSRCRRYHPEGGSRGEPDRVTGYLGRAQPRTQDGHSPLQCRLSQDVQRGVDPWISGLAVGAQCPGGLDEQPGRGEAGCAGGRRRASKVERSSREAERRRRRSRRRSERRPARRRDVFKLSRQEGKEEEDQEEEGVQGEGEDCRDKAPGPGFWQYRDGSKARQEEVHTQESAEGCKEEREARRFIDFELPSHLTRERQHLRRRREAFRGRGSSQDALEEVPGRPDTEHYRAHADLGSVTVGSAMGGGSSSSTSDILPILEDEPLYKDGRCHGTRVSDIELHPGHAHPGENRGRVRCDHAAPKGLRANLQRGTFLDSPAAGAGTNRYGCDEYPHGISGSSPTAAGGAEGKGSKCTDMGSAAGLGTPGRRKQRERKRERSEGQGQIKDRQSRSSKGGARQGKEVRSTDDGEPPGSVTVSRS